MKIIENNDTIRVVCPHCKSVLAVCKEDITPVEMGGCDYCICAACDKSIDIQRSMIPNHWRYYLYKDFD